MWESSQTTGWTCVSCIGRQILYYWATGEPHQFSFCFEVKPYPFEMCILLLTAVIRWGKKTKFKKQVVAVRSQGIFSICLIQTDIQAIEQKNNSVVCFTEGDIWYSLTLLWGLATDPIWPGKLSLFTRCHAEFNILVFQFQGNSIQE